MATKGERQALLFLAAVALLGAGTRLYHARHEAVPTADLDRQIGAVEAPSTRGRNSGRGATARKRGRTSGLNTNRESDSGGLPPASPSAAPDAAPSTSRVDVDLAPPADIERLPGVGPALAKRIVADREANGAFGCLAALDAVRGIGPVLLARLDSLVAFSGAPRPACAQR